MRINLLHAWPGTVVEAREVLESLRRVDITGRLPARVKRVAAAVVEENRAADQLYAAVCVVDADSMEVVEVVTQAGPASFPYLPGFVTFRELPPLVQACARLKEEPDVIMVNRAGTASGRLSVATHLGMWLGRSTIGCATRAGSTEPPTVGAHAGSTAPLVDPGAGGLLGMAVRTSAGAAPVFVSAGFRVTLPEAAAVVISQCRGQPLPEAMRAAMDAVNRLRTNVRGLDPEMASLVKKAGPRR